MSSNEFKSEKNLTKMKKLTKNEDFVKIQWALYCLAAGKLNACAALGTTAQKEMMDSPSEVTKEKPILSIMETIVQCFHLTFLYFSYSYFTKNISHDPVRKFRVIEIENDVVVTEINKFTEVENEEF